MRVAHLFAGAGGGLLADLILGHKPVLAVEVEESCCNSMKERIEDGWLPSDLHIHCGDIREFDFTPWCNRVDCISAGFPCQDISCAGSGKGIKGARSGLVSEVFRAIDDIRPGLVFLENSPHIRTKGRHIIIGELVARGYSWKDGTLEAADVGAGHKRERWWCLAANRKGVRRLQTATYAHGLRWEQGTNATRTGGHGRGESAHSPAEASDTDGIGRNRRAWSEPEKDGWNEPADGGVSTADTLRHRLQVAVQCGGLPQASAEAIEAAARHTGAYHWSPPDCGICGVVDGVAAPMDGNTKKQRIKAAGNGQVPLQAAVAWIILSGE